MNKELAKEYIKNMTPSFLLSAPKKVNGHTSYICPNCGNGSGKDGDGIALIPHSKTKRYKCFVCGLNEDIIGLWKIYKNINNTSDAINSLYEYYSIKLDNKDTIKTNNQKFPFKGFQNIAQFNQYESNQTFLNSHNTIYNDNNNQFTKYYTECKKRISLTDYPETRGLSKEIINNFNLGFDPYFKTKDANTNEYTNWKALIIPTGPNSFIARNTDLKSDTRNRYRKKGPSLLFNTKILSQSKKPIFIVEGELDALSIQTVNSQAIALGSTENYKKLIKLVKENRPVQPLIIALDNDANGNSTSLKLSKELKLLNIPFYRVNIYGKYKDANEALLSDKESFINEIAKAENMKIQENLEQKNEYLKNSNFFLLRDFLNGISQNVNTACIPTGFSHLDTALDGGLYEGLYIIGAISSLGKTSLCLQIADQIAKYKEDVLIFSLEMSKTELIAKSISRLTLLDVIKNNNLAMYAKTSREITTSSRYKNYSKAETDLIKKAINDYENYARNIYIHEGIADIGINEIKKIIDEHILFTGKKPTVIIDYLQILAPLDIRAADKQNIDKSVTALKRISRDYKIPIIAISSFNRANYDLQVNMTAFKESGAIEYSSDVLLGLQLKGTGSKNFDANEAKCRDPRQIEIVILKNRNGITGKKIAMEYYPSFNYFKELKSEQ